MCLSFSQEPELLVATPSLWRAVSQASQAGKSKSWGYKSRPAFKLQVQVVPIVITSVRFAPATLPLKFLEFARLLVLEQFARSKQ